jgi:hypothetical protein
LIEAPKKAPDNADGNKKNTSTPCVVAARFFLISSVLCDFTFGAIILCVYATYTKAMENLTSREKKALAEFKKLLATPEVVAKRYTKIAFLLVGFSVVVAGIAGHLIHRQGRDDLGMILAMGSGILIGLALAMRLTAKQLPFFARFCTLKSEYTDHD